MIAGAWMNEVLTEGHLMNRMSFEMLLAGSP